MRLLSLRRMPLLMMSRRISGFTAVMTASTTTNPRKMIRTRLYGAAKRRMRLPVPFATRASVTDWSRRSERIAPHIGLP